MSFFGMDPWIVWGIVAVAFFIAEIFLPSFWMAIVSIGAIGASITAAAGGSVEMQFAILSIISIITGIFFRPFAIKYIYRSSAETKPVNVDALIGKKVPVIQKITPENPGKVKIGSEVWKALPADEGTYNEGDFVIVSEIDGAKVIVKHSSPAGQ